MFDDSSDITNNREIVKHNENSRTKVVSKRSINSNSEHHSGDEEEANWWVRFKRSVQHFFGYDSEETHEALVNHIDDKQQQQQSAPELLPPSNLMMGNESEMQRRKREHLDDDDEDDDDDNEIGSGDQGGIIPGWDNTTPENDNDDDDNENESENINEIEVNTPLPDILDSKYCKS